ncbi:MAG: hypothetical protein KGI84_10325, partial [Elusimicrobia bacterium]|nr:hypothetical protein [Elusimicrobiota bacterium]
CAALARLLCPRAEFAPAAAGLALAWAAAAAGTAALALGNAASFGAALAAFWGGIGLRALLFVFLAALCFAQAGAVPALLAYAGGTAAALLALESRWLLRTR